MLKKLGWDKDLTEAELAVIKRIKPTNSRRGLLVDRSVGRHPARRDEARLHALRQRQGARERVRPAGRDPVHREPIYTPRPDLVAKYPTLPNARQFRMPNVGFDVQKAAVEKGIAKQFPLILTSGRLVEYEGGGEETRSNKWLAELQQDMFIEINPADATERGIKDGGWVWVTGAETIQGAHEGAGHGARRQGRGMVPVPLRGLVPGRRSARKYPQGADPVVLGESVNTLTTYGFDPVTGMQEPKATLCQIRAA